MPHDARVGQLCGNATLASITSRLVDAGGHPTFVSGGTEHQAPPGQAPIAAIVRSNNTYPP